MAEYLYMVQMDIPAELESEFNRIYDEDHIPVISALPGVLGVTRYCLVESAVKGVARFVALYRIASPDLPNSPAWREAADKGEWKPKIRPHTFNRTHSIYRQL
ncbi:MAG: hypothetical protein AB7O60_20150 [Variibacter sp.]